MIRWHLTFLRQTGIEPVPEHADFFSILSQLSAMKLVTSEGSRADVLQKVRPVLTDAELEPVLREDPKLKLHVGRC